MGIVLGDDKVLNVYLIHDRVPRTTTREEWRMMDRQRRIRQREAADVAAQARELLRDGFEWPSEADRLAVLNSLINPPVCFLP